MIKSAFLLDLANEVKRLVLSIPYVEWYWNLTVATCKDLGVTFSAD